MRVNVYDEETTDKIEIVEKTVDGVKFTGVRLYLAFPGPDGKPNFFMHRPGDDDSSAVTFWSKGDPGKVFRMALAELEKRRK